MPLSGSNKKDYQRRYMQAKRSNKEGEPNTQGLTRYHPLLYWLIDPEKRKKLICICEALSRRRLLDKVYLGCGGNSVPMDMVSQYIEATN